MQAAMEQYDVVYTHYIHYLSRFHNGSFLDASLSNVLGISTMVHDTAAESLW